MLGGEVGLEVFEGEGVVLGEDVVFCVGCVGGLENGCDEV